MLNIPATLSLKSLVRSFVLVSTAGVLLAQPAKAAWRMEVLPQKWHLAGFENSLDLSGIAGANGRQFLAGSDESFYVQPGELDPATNRIESRPPIALPMAAKGKREADIEGVTFSKEAQAYFVVGSHGLGKKKGDFQPDRHWVYRLPVDGSTGEVKEDAITRTSLLPWLEKTPELAAHVKKPLQDNGLNIEGLATREGRLYFGLRAPHVDGRGIVIEVSAEELFQGEPKKLTLHEIAVPPGRGIRDVVALKNGFLLVTGNASSEASKKIPRTLAPGPDNEFELQYWDGAKSSAPMKIGELPQNGGKAEALLVLGEDEKQVDVLVVFDGLPGGEPLRLRLHR
jgi:hypothetical protein